MRSARHMFSASWEARSILRLVLKAVTLAAGTATVLAAEAGAAPPAPSASAALLRVFGGLCVALGVFVAFIWLWKRWPMLARAGCGARLRILESRSLGPRQALHVVAYDSERILIATSPAGVSLVSALPPGDGAEPKPAPAAGFAEAFAHALGRRA